MNPHIHFLYFQENKLYELLKNYSAGKWEGKTFKLFKDAQGTK